jgi:hypothetical protein
MPKYPLLYARVRRLKRHNEAEARGQMDSEAEAYLTLLIVMLATLAIIGAAWLHFGR